MTELIRQIESGEPFEFTPEHAEALRMNAELATAKWVPADDGRIRWGSIRNQLQLTRWRFLPRLPEVAAILRTALMRLPEGPERVEMLGLLDRWVGGGGPGGSASSAGGTGTGPAGPERQRNRQQIGEPGPQWRFLDRSPSRSPRRQLDTVGELTRSVRGRWDLLSAAGSTDRERRCSQRAHSGRARHSPSCGGELRSWSVPG